MMKPHEPTLEKLFRELPEAWLREALLEATGEELLHQARTVSRTVEERVRRATAP
jgi:hypothetical protein